MARLTEEELEAMKATPLKQPGPLDREYGNRGPITAKAKALDGEIEAARDWTSDEQEKPSGQAR